MNYWDLHRRILTVGAALLGLSFLLWLFYLRGLASASAQLDTDFKDSLTKEIDEYCAKTGWSVSELQSRLEKANAALTERLEKRKQELGFKFSAPLIPEEQRARPQPYVRTQLRSLRDYLEVEAVSKRNIELGDNAHGLGFEIPDIMEEDLERDEEWLRQMEVMRRFIDLLFSVHQPAGERSWNIARITALRPLPPVLTGPEPCFMREYPLEAELLITLRGLLDLLGRCSRPETFHVIQALEVESDPLRRCSQPFVYDDAAAKIRHRWHEHYLPVRIKLSALTLVEVSAEEQSTAAARKAAPAGPGVIGH